MQPFDLEGKFALRAIAPIGIVVDVFLVHGGGQRVVGPAQPARVLTRSAVLTGFPDIVEGAKAEIDVQASGDRKFKLLELLARRRGRVQTRERLLQDVWGYENPIDSRTVDTHMRRLRDKTGDTDGVIALLAITGPTISRTSCAAMRRSAISRPFRR